VKGGSPSSETHRVPGVLGPADPYLVGATLLQVGPQGIEDGLAVPEPSNPDSTPGEDDPSFEELPLSLDGSLSALEEEPASDGFVGEELLAAHTAMRRYELSSSRTE
jgi:glutamine synthetase